MALTTDKDTLYREGDIVSHGAAGSTKSFAGGIGVLNAAGFLQPGAVGTGLKVVGRISAQVDNTDGADGDVLVQCRKGVFKYKNSVTNTVDITHLETDCYIEDDETVGSLATGMSVAGKVFAVDSDGVWVDHR